MSNVFDSRARAPQFPQRRALRTRSPFARGGSVPGYFLGGLFDSSPGSSSTSSNSESTFNVMDPNYNALKDYVLTKGLDLTQNSKFTPYGSNPIVGLTSEQQKGILATDAGQGNYQPFYNQAAGTVGNVQGAFDPSRGQSYVDQAGQMQNGSGAANPFLQAGTQTFPSAMQQYMSPYTDNVVHGIQDASNRNFEQNTMRSINDTFTGGNAAQFGREQHGNAVGNAVFAKTQADDAAVANALQSGYSTAGGLFNADQSRQLQAGQTAGGLAQGDIGQRAGLGQTAAGIQGTNAGTGLGIGQAQVGLGQNTQNSNLADANALLQAGQVGQTTAQNQSNFNYNEFQQKQQYPFQLLNYGQGLSQGWQLPTQTNNYSNSTTTQTQPQGSPFGQILGAGLGIAGLATPGAGGTSAGGNILGGIRGLFGSADGGYVDETKLAQGGMVPTIRQMRQKGTMRPPGPAGMMPTGMPGMPPMAPPIQPGSHPNGQIPTGRPGTIPYARGGSVQGFDRGGPYGERMGMDASDTPIPMFPPPEPPIQPAPPPPQIAPAPPAPAVQSGGGGGGGGSNPLNAIMSILPLFLKDGGSTGSPFLDASEGLDQRVADQNQWNSDRPSPFYGQGPYDNDTPSGPDAVLQNDPLMYLWRHLPQNVRDALSFGRDIMPDKAIGSALESSGDMGRSMMQGNPFGAASSGAETLLNLAGVMAPGAGRGARALMDPLVKRMVR